VSREHLTRSAAEPRGKSDWSVELGNSSRHNDVCAVLVRARPPAVVAHALSEAVTWPDYRLGSERGSPNQGSTLASKRVMPQIRSPVSESA
jgi:hypothetical protein